MNKAFTLWTNPANVRAYLSTEFCGNHIIVDRDVYRIVAYFGHGTVTPVGKPFLFNSYSIT